MNMRLIVVILCFFTPVLYGASESDSMRESEDPNRRLYWAALTSTRETSLQDAQEALADGAQVNALHDGAWFPLVVACVHGKNPLIVKLLLDAQADIEKTFNGETSLMMATDSPIVKLLIQMKADLDRQNDDGDTALHQTLKYDDKSNGEKGLLLLDAGASVNILNNEGQTALLIAQQAEFGHYNRELIRRISGRVPPVEQKNNRWCPIQ